MTKPTQEHKRENAKRMRKESIDRSFRLLEALLNENLSPELKKEIRAWFKSNASIEAKYDALRLFFELLKPNLVPDQDEYRQFEELMTQLPPQKKKSKRAGQTLLFFPRRILYIAASVIFAVCIAGGLYLSEGGEESGPDESELLAGWTTISATPDQQAHLFLPDGSEVWLNASSTLSYSEDFGSGREVELNGEAYFEVKHLEGSPPFRVKTEKLTVTVLGTKFNVKAYGHDPETEVTLDTGKVEVSAGDETHTLRPQERLLFDRRIDRVQLEELVAEQQETWRNGMEFKDTPLREVLSAFATHFNLKIEISGRLPDDRITFGFGYDATPELLLSILKETHDYFSYEIEEGVVRIVIN